MKVKAERKIVVNWKGKKYTITEKGEEVDKELGEYLIKHGLAKKKRGRRKKSDGE